MISKIEGDIQSIGVKDTACILHRGGEVMYQITRKLETEAFAFPFPAFLNEWLFVRFDTHGMNTSMIQRLTSQR